MESVWKFTIALGTVTTIEMPEAASFLTTRLRPNEPEVIDMWARVSIGDNLKHRRFAVTGTGHPLPADLSVCVYVGTVFDDQLGLVWHVWELISGDN